MRQRQLVVGLVVVKLHKHVLLPMRPLLDTYPAYDQLASLLALVGVEELYQRMGRSGHPDVENPLRAVLLELKVLQESFERLF